MLTGGASGCGLNEDIVDWMSKVQNSGTPDPPPPSSSSSSKSKSTLSGKFGIPRTNGSPWINNIENPIHKYTRAANNEHHRNRRATRPKEENRNTCSLFIQTDPFIWRHISEQVNFILIN